MLADVVTTEVCNGVMTEVVSILPALIKVMVGIIAIERGIAITKRTLKTA